MKRTTSLAFGLIVIAIAVLIVLALGQHPRSTPVTTANGSQIAAATSTLTASTTEYTVDASYPQFGVPSIDAQIKTEVETAMNDLITQANQDKPAENGFPLYIFTSSFSNLYIGPDYISAQLVLAQYTGGAHELPIVIGENFHSGTGQRVTLDEALALTGQTLDQVAAAAKQQLAQNPDTQPRGIWASGSDPVPDNYQTFLITKDTVIFIFQPYQVAPYSSGAPQISIPRVI